MVAALSMNLLPKRTMGCTRPTDAMEVFAWDNKSLDP